MNDKKCIYCGAFADTEDHIPSKNLFPQQDRQDAKFVKVPSCSKCNSGFSKDEEFVRNYFASLAHDHSSKAVELFNTTIKRSIQKRPALGRSFMRKMSLVDIYTPAGIYVGKRTKVKITDQDLDRIYGLLGNKYIKGLTYSHFGLKLPDDHIIRHAWVSEDNPTFSNEQIMKAIAWNLDNEQFFLYGMARIPETMQSVWISVFFEKIIILSFVFPLKSEMSKVATKNLFSVKPQPF